MLKQPASAGEFEVYSAEVQTNAEFWAANPFPGLRPFTIDECHLFFWA